MKTNKLQIFSLVALGAFIGLTPMVRADDSTPATPPPAAGGGTSGPAAHGNRHAALDKFLDSINATADQKEQVTTLLKGQADQMKTLRQDTSLSTDDRKAKHKEIMEATNTKVKGVLSADQYTKYEEFMKQQGPGHRKQQPQN
jgi:protein CpxP